MDASSELPDKSGPSWLRAWQRGRFADAVLAGLVMLIIAMMIVPLPTWLIDQLIALNLSLSLLLLVTALYVPHGLSFTSMPSVLLISTLYRLALNVSSTRLILLQADAGRVIRAFGGFVVRGDYVVGAVIFLIVSLIQYLVVAKGGERVAEVAARFTLDAMPGKQLAIDADLRAGGLRVEAAQARRALLERESRFYGAMDGAMKFIKGDAIASLIITAIAFVGGSAIGVWKQGLGLEAAVTLYGLLAIGDGLVSQLPALVTSIAAGLTVTRVAEQEASSLGQDVIAQLFDRPRSLFAVAAALAMLASVPGLPAWPFLLLGVFFAVRGARVRKLRETLPRVAPLDPPRLRLELGAQLMASMTERAQPAASPPDHALTHATSTLAEQLGVTVPTWQHGASALLPPDAFTLYLRGVPLLRGRAQDGPELGQLLEAELEQALRRRARELFTLDDLQQRCDKLALWAPTLVQSVVPRVFTATQLLEILRRLLDERVGIHALERILDALSSCGTGTVSIERGLEAVRHALRERLSETQLQDDTLSVHMLDPLIEDALRDATQSTAGERSVALAPDLAEDVVRAVRKARALHATAPVLVTQNDVRRSLYEVLKDELPDVTVLSYSELPTNIMVERRELITVADSS
jgi:type III secretion protein V